VFNGRGAQVPHAIRSLRTGAPKEAETLQPPLFPLHAAAPQHEAAAPSLSLVIERDTEGRVVRLAAKTENPPQPPPLVPRAADKRPAPPQTKADVDAGAPVEPPPPVAAYILDARAAERPIVSLRVQVRESGDERVLPLRLEASDDLVHFVDVPVEGALIQLGHGGQRIDRDRITIRPTHSPFYRLSAAREPIFPVSITNITATLADVEPARPFEKVTAEALASEKPQVFDFDLGGPVPVDRIEFQLPENNTIVNAEIFAASERNGPWSSVVRARLYRVTRAEAEVTGPTLEVARRSTRFYQLRVESTGGGLGAGEPVLVTYHAPDQLLFLRRGEGPFTLAYGRYQVEHARFEADDLLSLLPEERGPTAIGSLSEVKTLGGKGRLTPPKPPPPYKTYAVWAVLVAGVALLGGIALRLARSSDRKA
jgi:hypothetical protein